MATDPVCGMTVPQHDHPHLQLDQTVWWFCSPACRDEFATNPSRFLHRLPPRAAVSAARRQ